MLTSWRGLWLLGLCCLLHSPALRAQVTLRLTLEPDEVTYSVYMISATGYAGIKALISSSQVTLVVPHGAGADRFVVKNLRSPVPDMRWVLNTRVDAPVENPAVDYLSFSFLNTSSPLVTFDIPANQPILLFQFTRSGPCLGAAELVNNQTDAFRPPNSTGTNVGNSLSVLGAGGNTYRDNTDPAPTVSILPLAGPLCAGQVVLLSATLAPMPTEVVVYEWFLNEKSLGAATAVAQLAYTLPRQPTGASVPMLRVRATIRGATRCRDRIVTATQPLPVQNPPDAIVTYAGPVCTELPVVLPATTAPGAAYQWQRNGTPIAGATASLLTVNESGTYSVSLTAGGCGAVSAPLRLVGVPKNEQTTVSLGPAQTVVAGLPTQLRAVVSNVAAFTWTPATGLSDPASLSPVVTIRQTMTYTLHVESAAGCPASDSVQVLVLPGLLIPDVFTPNGDGINDTWLIRHADRYGPCTVTVYDRWGRVVYHSEAYAAPGWDGQTAGQSAAAGVYPYVVQTNVSQYRGSLHLDR